jgi:protein SCO1/2
LETASRTVDAATLPGVRRGLPSLAVVALVAGCGGAKQAARTTATPRAEQLAFAGGGLTEPRPSPPISLHDVAGRRVTLAAQRGRYVLVTFLYTHCPDVCPQIAQNLNAALRLLGPKRSQVRVLAVSVDPRGDTRAAVRRYIRERGLLPEFRYLLGTPAQLRTTWAHWSVSAVSQSPALVDHVAYTALVDTAGRQRVLYDSQVKARQVLHDIRLLMRSRA